MQASVNKFDYLKDIVFNLETHAYSVIGAPYPSVTQVMPKHMVDYSKIPNIEYRRNEGTAKHLLLGCAIKTGEYGNDPSIKVILDWIEQMKPVLGELVGSELVLLHRKHRYCGTCDLLFERGVVDLKSFIEPKVNALQLAGYFLAGNSLDLCEPNSNWYAITSTDDKVTAVNVFHPLAISTFLACVQKYWAGDNLDWVARMDEIINKYLNSI